jgi:hypothetical protein
MFQTFTRHVYVVVKYLDRGTQAWFLVIYIPLHEHKELLEFFLVYVEDVL